ncbi:NAD(P)/FAD-dependent oxidoreductase [Tardiphaga sp.]|jgi:3-phenylpropionate/trans-cinnamate dioxygenase ferredoxin reductase subunit|uniref:NAD(P)/FAD-dependent oxidoreductase n=1 Tax=Tardiphaga sp. TaxID=1926292 RepID=UPI0037D9B986
MSDSDPIVIVGAGHAGFQLALCLRQSGYSGNVTLINDEAHPPYQRPPLSKAFMKSGSEPESLHFRPASFFEAQQINVRAGRVVEIDRNRRQVELADGSLKYRHLVLAVGAKGREFPPVCSSSNQYMVRTLDDAVKLRERMSTSKSVVIVGAGFIGLEFAATARKAGLQVHIVEMGARAMERAVSPAISAYFQARHVEAGIHFHFGEQVVSALEIDGKLRSVKTSSGMVLDADLLVIGIGIVPNTDIASSAGLLVSPHGIMVDQHLSTSDPAISAIGDCTFFPCRYAPSPVRIESVQNATDQARCVAARLTGKPSPYDAVPWFWSDQGNDKLQIVGLTQGYDEIVFRGSPDDGVFSTFCYSQGRLIGIESVNRPADHMIGRKILSEGRLVTPEQARDSQVDLKRVA